MTSDEPFSSNLKRGFHEIWLLVRRRPVEDRAWRDFWITWLPGFLPFIVFIVVVDPPFFSLAMLVALVATALWGLLGTRLFTRLGLIGKPGEERPI